MPELNWIGRESVLNHHNEIPIRLLRKNKSASIGDSENLIIQGDNLEALKALLPYYKDKIKCIYIDPPYNTGNENWTYNDNVNSPKIKKWLGKVVDSEDLTKHDKWLCMMYPRLKLLRELLSDDGVIFVSIDDNEVEHLKIIMNNIFSTNNFIAQIVWQKKYAAANDVKHISNVHDYLLVYTKQKNLWIPNLFPRPKQLDEKYSNPDNDPRGNWYSTNLSVKTYSTKYDYTITSPKGLKFDPPPSRCWVVNKEKYNELLKDNRIWFGKNGTSRPYLKKFLSEVQQGIVPTTLWFHQDAGHTIGAKSEIRDIFYDNTELFDTPKPTKLIKRILQIASTKDCIILDSFAGSGTTGHAVLDLNKEDGGNRKFILIELESEIYKNITKKRISKVIKGYKDVKGTGGDYSSCTLSKPLFDSDGMINLDCTFDELANYIYFTETNKILNKKLMKKEQIGLDNNTHYYLIFSKIGINELSYKFLKSLPKNKDRKIIYADKCDIPQEKLDSLNIVFKQIPYEVKLF